MVNFKSLDFFRKTDQTRHTVTGGCVSLLSLISITVLCLTQLEKFMTPQVKKDMIVTSNLDVDPTIDLHMDIVFPNAPCGILDFQFATGHTQLSRFEMTDFSFFDVKRSTGQVIGEAEKTHQLPADEKQKKIKQQLVDGVGCQVKGKHEMYQVPSKLLFASDKDMWLLHKLKAEDETVFNRFSMEHYFKEFAFGDLTQQEGILAHFADYPEHTRLDMVKEDAEENRAAILAKAPEELKTHFNHFKYISIVPHIFVDTSTSEQVDYRSYSYAITTNKKAAELQPELNMVMMTFEFSPVSMQITKSRQPLARFLINICAVVGGVFVVFGMVNTALLQMQKKARGSE